MHLVTGGAGFIGSHLVAGLAARGLEVAVCDRLRSGGKWRNLAPHPVSALVHPDEMDAWLDSSEGRRVEGVLHMGAVSATTARDGDLVARENLGLTLRLWGLCAARGVPFVYASSAATYGDGSAGFDDATPLDALRPLNLYGWSKHAADRAIADRLARGRPAPPRWGGLKFFNVYGPGEAHKGRMASVVLHKFREVARGEPPALFASDREGVPDGGQMRDFVHVSDCAAAALWLLLDAPAGASGLHNMGTGTARSFRDLALAVCRATNAPPQIRYVPMPDDLRGRYQYFTEARMDRLRAAGFDRPPTPLEEGVAAYVRAMREDPALAGVPGEEA